MNKNATPSAPISDPSNIRKPKKKVQKVRLPTPPPDPRLHPVTPTEQANSPQDEKKQQEKDADILDYLENLQKCTNPPLGRSASIFAPTIAAEDAFDHLDKLYKLMEQMLVLREQNAKLHRRIRDLEHFRNIQKLQKQLEINENTEFVPLESDKDAAFAESLLDTMLMSTKRDMKTKFSASSRLRQSILRRQRNRASSMAMDKTSDYDISSDNRRASAVITPSSEKSAKVSKWKKVKSAFKWEKASPTVSGTKTPESDSGLVPMNLEVARYLRVPSTSEDLGSSPVDSGAAGISTPGTLSSTSSLEDLQYGRKGETRDYSSDDDQSFSLADYIPHSKDEPQHVHKSKSHQSRTPWAKMKDIIQQPRSSFKKRHRLSTQSDDIKLEDSDNEDVFLSTSVPSSSCSHHRKYKLEKSLSFPERTHRIPPEIIERYQNIIAEDLVNKDDPDARISRWTRVKKAFLTSTNTIRNAAEDENANLQTSKDQSTRLQEEIEQNYKQLQNQISLEFHNKILEWEKSKLGSTGYNTSSSATPSVLSGEDPKDQAFMKKMEEWEKIKSQPRSPIPAYTSRDNLPPDFKKKLEEWQKIKKSSTRDDPTTSSSTPRKKLSDIPKCKSVGGFKTEYSPLDQKPLSHEFLKKLETWKQIKSGNHPYSDDCESKKSVGENKTPSPRMVRKDSGSRQSKKIKDQTDKELQWFEKELGKIEREKQRLERERQKFLEREERLSKLRKSVIGNNKKEVLVHTPTGFYRFEGISRKFTQKLYEWEKAQGIGPEASTFALLTSSHHPEILMLPQKRDNRPGTLYRSKSADSIANSVQNLTCPILSQQPSSLSLNDMENLEKDCMLDSRISSIPDIIRSTENIASDEPEAVIVEVEAVYEETAAPLVTFFEKQETPVYQHQEENQKLFEGKKNSGPKVRRSESARAQTNYNLIEDSINIIKTLTENEKDIEDIENGEKPPLLCNDLDRGETLDSMKSSALMGMYELQSNKAKSLMDKLAKLQEANSTVAANITNDDSGFTVSHLVDVLDNVQDLSSELIQLANRLASDLNNRFNHGPHEDTISFTKANYPNIFYCLKLLNSKVLEIRRELSYLCAASDMTAPSKKKKLQRRGILRRRSQEDKNTSNPDTSVKDSSSTKDDDSSSVDTNPSPIGQGAVRKRIRYRQKEPTFYKPVNESDEDGEDYREQRKIRQKRFSKSRSGSEGNSIEKPDVQPKIEKPPAEDIVMDPDIIEKVVVPTNANIVDSDAALDESQDSPVTVFVKTTRKLFTPIATSALGNESPARKESPPKNVCQITRKSLSPCGSPKNSPRPIRKISLTSTNTTSSTDTTPFGQKTIEEIKEEQTKSVDSSMEGCYSQSDKPISHLPPLPASPVPQRRILKDISPSIRIMMERYHQKISEGEILAARSGGSSGSASPTAWRSPVSERRVRAQTEKYQEELNKLSPLLGGRRSVQKSSSLGIMQSGNKQVTIHGAFKEDDTSPETSPVAKRGILKSSSTVIPKQSSSLDSPKVEERITMDPRSKEIKACLRLNIPPPTSGVKNGLDTPDERKLKILKAREEFLRSPLPSSSSPQSASPNFQGGIQYPRTRLSQVSVGSESSCDSSACSGLLVKSASAGMINVDPSTYKQIDPAVHQDGYVSLPRSSKKPKEGFLSNLTSKFRKVKMRRHKDKLNTISTLCRQSLVVDISSDSQEALQSAPPSEQNKNLLNVPSDSNRGSSSEDMSAESSRSGKWITRPRIFKPKQ